MNKDILKISKELYDLICTIKGVQKVSENTSLTYICVVEDDEAKENVNKVAESLMNQASQHNLELSIIPFTEQDLEKIKEVGETSKEEKTFY